ncbi:MAG: hypothetical protein KA198_04755 [Chitinophagaceae bacterium]|nr:hypothetical protein [Chitinophagaceae bacterium]
MKQPLVIQILNPCHENWDEMTLTDQGKFCSNCQKVVIDFSEKTDAELVDYFNTHSSFCGRFKQTQIDRYIETPKPVLKRLFHFYSKFAALFFTAFSFKGFQASGQTNHPRIENFVQNADEIHSAQVTIEGKITDDADRFVDSVAIFFDNVKVATSSQEGYYKVVVENIALKNHVLSFSKNNYRSTAISFHPLMGNTSYDITMCNYKGKECYSMGMPAQPHIVFEKFEFKIDRITLSIGSNKELKRNVDKLASVLRNSTSRGSYDPIVLKIYFKNEVDKKMYQQRAQEILEYLVGSQGIDRDRIQLKVIKDAQKANMIEVVDYTEE